MIVLVAALAALLIVPPVVGVVRTHRRNVAKFNDITARRETDPGGIRLKPGELRERIFGTWLFGQWLGVYWAVGRWFGNCFSPAVVVTWHGWKAHAWLTLTLRGEHRETVFHVGRPLSPLFYRDNFTGALMRNHNRTRPILPRLWWNSEHLAYWFGEGRLAPNDDTVYTWKSRLLGSHSYV
jgi:hypothetical protein